MYIRNSMLDYLQVCISIGQWFGVSFISNINCQLSYRYFLIFINSFMDHLQPTFNVSLFPGVYIGYFIFLRSTYSRYCLVYFLQTLSVIYIRFNGEFYPALIFSLFSCVYICYFLVWWIIYIVHSMLSHLQMRSVTFFTSKYIISLINCQNFLMFTFSFSWFDESFIYKSKCQLIRRWFQLYFNLFLWNI